MWIKVREADSGKNFRPSRVEGDPAGTSAAGRGDGVCDCFVECKLYWRDDIRRDIQAFLKLIVEFRFESHSAREIYFITPAQGRNAETDGMTSGAAKWIIPGIVFLNAQAEMTSEGPDGGDLVRVGRVLEVDVAIRGLLNEPVDRGLVEVKQFCDLVCDPGVRPDIRRQAEGLRVEMNRPQVAMLREGCPVRGEDSSAGRRGPME